MLVVSEICSGRYGAGRAREGSARGTERLMGGSASGAAAGVEEEIRGRSGVSTGGESSIMYRYSCLSTIATSLLAETFKARDSLRIIPSVGDFSPRSS